jgi:IclR family transcriptional regulator, acetate operon repressor
VGPAAQRVGDASSRELATLALPALRAAVEASGETANIAGLEGEVMVYLAQAPSPHTLRIFAEVGRRVPLHSTAVGKVVLAGMEREQAGTLLRGLDLEARTPRTLTTVDAVEQELGRVREQGYAVDDEEQELGVRCVAVPVGAGRWGALALSVSGPTERMTRDRSASVVPRLQQIADDLAHRVLGGR